MLLQRKLQLHNKKKLQLTKNWVSIIKSSTTLYINTMKYVFHRSVPDNQQLICRIRIGSTVIQDDQDLCTKSIKG